MDVIDAPVTCERVKGTTYLVKGEYRIWTGTRWNCEHGKKKSICRECGGSSFCEHNKRKAHCLDCGGSALCKHNKLKSRCRECGGSAFCKHNKLKTHCRECGGSSLCKHNKQKAQCLDCGGSSFCKHNKWKSRCQDCKISDVEIIKVDETKKRKIIKQEVEELENERPTKRSSRRPPVVKVKDENIPGGLIKCPKCDNGIVVTKGCNTITCRQHRPKFFYFCFHCRRESISGIPCMKCPYNIDETSKTEYLCNTTGVLFDKREGEFILF